MNSRPGLRSEPPLMDQELESVRGAKPLDDHRPMIVFDGGLRSDALSYVVLAEFLASHGYVCISLPSLPLAGGKPLTFDEAGIRAKAQQVVRVSRLSASLPGADITRMAFAGWSVGGVSTAIAARHTSGVRALISLDGGLGYDYGPPIAQAVLGNGSIASVPVLHVTGTAPNRHPVPKTFEVFERAGTAPVYRAEIDGLEHSHFVVHGGVVSFAGDDSPPALAFWRGNAALSRIVLLFVQAFLDDQVPAHDFAVRARTVAPDTARIFSSATR